MKAIFISSILFLTIFKISYCQQIQVKYGISTKELRKIDKSEQVSSDIINSMTKSFEMINSFEGVLKASMVEAIFSIDHEMINDVDPLKMKMARTMIGANNKYYYNLLKKKTSKYFEAYGEKVILDSDIEDFNWKLTNEKKYIDNYECFKAITYINKKTLTGVEKKAIVAYYSPELNYNFGPIGYCGLPGIILELHDDKFIYSAEEIVLSNETLNKLDLPKGKLITIDELDEMGEKARKNRGW